MMRIRVSISLAMLASVVLHALLLIAIEVDFKTPTLRQREPVVFTLVPQPHPPTNVEMAQKPLPLTTSRPKTTLQPLVSAPAASATRVETVKVIAPKTEPTASEPLVITDRSIKPVIVTRDTEAFEEYSAPVCSVSHKASLARRCVSTERPQIAEAPQLLAELFADLSSTNPNFKRDMDTVDRLVAQAANLPVLASSDPAQRALIAEQRRHLREEILRIDSAHQQANLLKLIPEAARIVRGLTEK